MPKRSFFALCSGQEPAAAGNPPILVYNPHPYPVDQLVECEFHLHDFNWRGSFFDAELFAQGGRQIPHQIERRRANATLDWGKRLAAIAVGGHKHGPGVALMATPPPFGCRR